MTPHSRPSTMGRSTVMRSLRVPAVALLAAAVCSSIAAGQAPPLTPLLERAGAYALRYEGRFT
ncbi:MAG TPA: hypothetical protein VKI43_19205, partial [Vicinamibacterales bacterium]|nr:hypothetical protein [Vicinamibacterales bacterium]